MKSSIATHAKRDVSYGSSRRSEWGWCGFGAGLLGYVVVSAVFGSLPDEESLKGIWLAVGLAPAFMGSCIGLALATVLD
jgi:hypothetical protein